MDKKVAIEVGISYLDFEMILTVCLDQSEAIPC